jgi:EAL domain-containing protein (putative c-di-GMP-specific phosphodiesterase class I)/PleD family two-component response regulator
MDAERINKLITITKRLKLLYVEDNEAARVSTMQTLGVFFDDVVVATNGKEGLEKFQEQKFDLVITDINMPKMNGIEMISNIRKTDNSVILLVLSAYNETNYFLETIKEGIEGYILKPIVLSQFIDLLEKVIKSILLQEKILDYQNNLEKKVAQQTLLIKEHYYHDSITGLENFIKLEEHINSHEFEALYILDISNFSIVLRQYGLVFSNLVLKEVAKTLVEHLKGGMKLFKIDSDKFVILSKQTDAENKEYCKQIISYYNTYNLEFSGVELNISFTIGVANICSDTDTLLNAEYALLRAKSLGAKYCVYEDIDENIIRREEEKVRWLGKTKKLIDTESFIPYYQAIIDTKTKQVFKYEVLARGVIDGEIIAPYYFLEAAERLGLMSSITKIMIQSSFAYFANSSHKFSINIAQRDLLEQYLPTFLEHKLQLHNINPSNVTLEILENITLLKESQLITQQLSILKKMGFCIAIDDFGVENSNFGRLVDINIDIIKIDGSFVKNLLHNPKDQKIVKSIVHLAEAMKIKTVAEYVETKEVFEMVKSFGVDYVQGYYFSVPHQNILQTKE